MFYQIEMLIISLWVQSEMSLNVCHVYNLLSANFWESDAISKSKFFTDCKKRKKKILKDENINKKKIPANFWVDKINPISPRGPPRSFRGQTFILKNLTPKITKICEFICL